MLSFPKCLTEEKKQRLAWKLDKLKCFTLICFMTILTCCVSAILNIQTILSVHIVNKKINILGPP